MTARRASIRALGKLLISVGIGTLMAVAWTFWGTGLKTAQEQRRLAERFETIRQAPSAPGSGVGHPPGSFAPGPGEPVFRIRIPAIELNRGKGYIVVEGVDQEQLELGPGHYPDCGPDFTPPYCTRFPAAWPGEKGRVIVSGHRTTHLAPFGDTDELEPGDVILIDTSWGTFEYRVYDQRSVLPDDPTIVVPRKRSELVLTTCDPPLSAARRLITFARLVSSEPPVAGLFAPAA